MALSVEVLLRAPRRTLRVSGKLYVLAAGVLATFVAGAIVLSFDPLPGGAIVGVVVGIGAWVLVSAVTYGLLRLAGALYETRRIGRPRAP